ncbi:MAG: hypothetical protein C4519_28680 [Desulfobacteraceae bacterium]|nr:MAG: hypothetical protein C4519_28680 [Desulfobacteraceae bacterium]
MADQQGLTAPRPVFSIRLIPHPGGGHALPARDFLFLLFHRCAAGMCLHRDFLFTNPKKEDPP